MQIRDKNGRSALVVATASDCAAVRLWALSYGAYLGRYHKHGLGPKYRSPTCEVWYATDLFGSQSEPAVALKIMKQLDHLQAEVETRYNQGNGLDPQSVLDFRCTHLPSGPTSQCAQHVWKVTCCTVFVQFISLSHLFVGFK